MAASGLDKGWFGDWGYPCHLCCTVWSTCGRNIPTKLLNSRLFLPQTAFNEATLFGGQIRCQNFLVSRDARGIGEILLIL